jgi:dephospho-CoA kinase
MEDASMLRVGLTGGIGAGKSEVSRRLAELGAVVIDADKGAREVVEPGTPGLAQIVAAFGEGVLLADGALDRAGLAAIVFADPDKLATLNSITHPLIHQWVQDREDTALRDGGPGTVIVHDVPLLAEGLRTSAGFDVVIVVDVPAELQIERLTTQRGMAADQAAARMAAQAAREQRLEIADVVIDNSGTLADLDERVAEVWAELRSKAAEQPRLPSV